MLNIMIAVALMATTPVGAPLRTSDVLPPLRVSLAGLDLHRQEGVRDLALRIGDASRDYCDHYIERLTPNAVGAPEVCHAAVADLLISKLERREWRLFMSQGGHRLLRHLQ